MRTILRSGGIVGGVGGVALAALQFDVALLAVFGIPLTGLVAGLCVAKWLDRWWYGRQFQAGAHAGLYAAGLAGCGTLASLLLRGPQSTDALATRSHLGVLSAAPFVHSLAFAGWIGVDVLGTVAGIFTGTVLSALTAQIMAWSKSGRALRVVEQARLAAAPLSEEDDHAPGRVSTPPQGIPAAALLNRLPGAAFTGAPVPTGAPALGLAAPGSGALLGARSSTMSPAPYAPTRGGGRRLAEAPEETVPVTRQGEPVSIASARRPRRASAARPREQQLTDAMKDALAAWASENNAGESSPARRSPQPSMYLNSAPPVPRRNRKKNVTRDWIC